MELQGDGNIRLVLAEDFKLARIGIQMVLSGDPTVSVIGDASTAEQALFQVRDLDPDLLLLDISLPDMNGLEVVREIRQFNQKIKIMVMASHESEEDVIEALAAGANAYCLKDVVSSRLVEAVKLVHAGKLWLDPRIASVVLHACNHQTLRTKKLFLKSQAGQDILQRLLEGMEHEEMMRAMEIRLHTSNLPVYSLLSTGIRTPLALTAV